MRALRVAALALLLSLALAQEDAVPKLTPGLIKDREGLLALKSKVTSFGTSQMETWKASGNPCLPVAWPHVTCSSDPTDPRVTKLDLSNRGVVGTLAVGLRKAGRLETVNLENNRFSGNIPNDWAKGNTFTRLRTLKLGNNELDGILPNFNRRGAWRALETLDLSANKFYGGLQANWLGKYRPLKNVKYLDLSGNLLGTTDGTTKATRAQWCPDDTGLKAGSGWCPAGTNTPITGTAAALVTLDLSNNGFDGEVPPKWPKMFPRLQYLKLQFNNLHYLSETLYKIPTALPGNWTTGPERGFPALSILTLYPGNDYLCSIPDDDGSFQDVNLAATYQIADASGEVYGDGNPRLCPTEYTDDNPLAAPPVLASETSATWSYTATPPEYIWGFKITILGKDAESEEWSPVENGNGVLLRTYTLGLDGGAQPAALTGSYALDFTAMEDENGDPAVPDLSAAGDIISAWKIQVSVINVDGVESSIKESAEVPN